MTTFFLSTLLENGFLLLFLDFSKYWVIGELQKVNFVFVAFSSQIKLNLYELVLDSGVLYFFMIFYIPIEGCAEFFAQS